MWDQGDLDLTSNGLLGCVGLARMHTLREASRFRHWKSEFQRQERRRRQRQDSVNPGGRPQDDKTNGVRQLGLKTGSAPFRIVPPHSSRYALILANSPRLPNHVRGDVTLNNQFCGTRTLYHYFFHWLGTEQPRHVLILALDGAEVNS
jgi:hypothetical protein